MSKEQLKVKKFLYRDRRGTWENKKTISELSITHGTVHLDRRNALYLVEENIRDDVNFDLTLGCREYFEESDEENSEGSDAANEEDEEDFSCTFTDWACLQPQKSLKEAFCGAEFVTYRCTIRDIAKTIITHRQFQPEHERKEIRCNNLEEVVVQSTYVNPSIKPWARVAIKAGDVIIIRDDSASPFLDDSGSEEYDDVDVEEEEVEEEVEERETTKEEQIVARLKEMRRAEIRQQTYSGYKFQQYMTSEDPQGKATPEKRLKIRVFETVMTGDLTAEGTEPIRLCCFAECDALRGDEPIELNSTFSDGFFNKIHTFLHCNFGNMNTVVTGMRNEDWITTRVFERPVSQLMNEFTSFNFRDSRADEQCFSFLHDVLSMTKQILTRAKACRFVYMPKSGIIQFEPITMKEAMKRGIGLPAEFKDRFNISD